MRMVKLQYKVHFLNIEMCIHYIHFHCLSLLSSKSQAPPFNIRCADFVFFFSCRYTCLINKIRANNQKSIKHLNLLPNGIKDTIQDQQEEEKKKQNSFNKFEIIWSIRCSFYEHSKNLALYFSTLPQSNYIRNTG